MSWTKLDGFLGSQSRPTAEQIAWVVAHLADHAMRGETFGVLLTRFILPSESYSLLIAADGMKVHNWLAEGIESEKEAGA
jgi:hypothetical protein